MSAITRLGTDQNKHNTYLSTPKQLSVLILLRVYIRLGTYILKITIVFANVLHNSYHEYFFRSIFAV